MMSKQLSGQGDNVSMLDIKGVSAQGKLYDIKGLKGNNSHHDIKMITTMAGNGC